MEKKFQSGSWSYFEDRMLIAFNPERDDPSPEIPIYGLKLVMLNSSARLLDIILQMQRKGRWSDAGKREENKGGTWLCDDFQLWDFILVLDSICRHYMKKSVQGVFSAWGEDFQVDWDKLGAQRKTGNDLYCDG